MWLYRGTGAFVTAVGKVLVHSGVQKVDGRLAPRHWSSSCGVCVVERPVATFLP